MDHWAALGGIARLVPTPHNTQPFRIRPRNDTQAELVLCCDRLLSEEDHGNSYIMSAFGMFLAALERAGLQLGRRVTCTPLAEFDPTVLVVEERLVVLGTVELGAACPVSPQQPLLELRRTSRLAYEDKEVPDAVLKALTESAAPHGQRLIIVSDPKVVQRTLELNAAAIIDNLQLDAEREEIRGWYRYGAAPEVGDGLWEAPMNQPAWELQTAFATPWLFAWPGFRGFALHRFLKTQRGTRYIALLCGPFRDWPALLSAGRGLFEIWLKMAEHGVYMQPFGSMLTNPVYAKQVAEAFEVDDCWLLFRFGYSAVPPRAPRLESIVIHE